MLRTLFAISIVALLALLWASISIARHISRSRQRRRKQNEYERLVDVASPTLSTPADTAAERADRAYYKEDMGDLSDPYQASSNRPKTRAEQ
jgi:hypothetical protein